GTGGAAASPPSPGGGGAGAGGERGGGERIYRDPRAPSPHPSPRRGEGAGRVRRGYVPKRDRASMLNRTIAGLSLAAALLASPAGAAETVTIGTVGQGSATNWPTYIAVAKGYFEAEGIKPDFVYTPGNAPLVQQLAAGSLDVALSSGLVDPLRAIDKGAPVVIVGLEMQSPPYALLAKPGIGSLADLKGKLISLGGPKDITRIFVERMLAPHGVKSRQVHIILAA